MVYKKIDQGVGYFIRPGQELDYFYIKIDLEVTFLNCTAEPKPQMPTIHYMTMSHGV